MALPLTLSEPARLDVAWVYQNHRDFMWLNLHRLGVPEADLPDVMQEVLWVVHRRLGAFNGDSKLTTWLFGICLRVAAAQRRRAHVRRERLTADPPEAASSSLAADQVGPALDARWRLERLLGELALPLRAVFVMFEIEGVDCARISDELGIPLGTVHSRLHKARKAFKRAHARLERSEAHQTRVVGGTR